MSVAIMTAVWRMNLPSTEKLVLLALADAANDDGITWIAVASKRQGQKLDLLTKTSLSERAIQGAIKRLSAEGHLRREERPGKGVIYHITPRTSCGATPAPPAPRTGRAPADNNVNPRTSCGETVSNRQKLVAVTYACTSQQHSVEDWPSDDLAELADLLIEEAKTDRLNPVRQAGLATTLIALLNWKRTGASWREVVVPIVTGIARQPGQPIRSWHFFDQMIADAQTHYDEPLKIPPPRGGCAA